MSYASGDLSHSPSSESSEGHHHDRVHVINEHQGKERCQPWSWYANKNNKYTACHIFLKDPVPRFLKPFISILSRLQRNCCCWKLAFKYVGEAILYCLKRSHKLLESYRCDLTPMQNNRKELGQCWFSSVPKYNL